LYGSHANQGRTVETSEAEDILTGQRWATFKVDDQDLQ
jgi:hypothetical protein